MKKVIMDVDTGTDDAIALMTAILSEEINLIGICTVNGNRGVDFTTENTLRVVEYLGQGDKIPVYKGCSLPMVSTLPKWRRPRVPYVGEEDPKENVHGDYLNLPPSTIKVQNQNAPSWIVDTLIASSGDISIIAVGPLTNLAIALRLNPLIAQKIEEIVIMGGGYHETNTTAAAEFNFWIDPEAAKIVLECGCKIRIVPLDATHAAAISTKDMDALYALGTKASVASAEIMHERLRGYNNWQPMSDSSTVPVHDALAVCAFINSDVLKDVVFCNVDINIDGGISDGMSVVDVLHKNKKAIPNASVALSADKELFSEMLKEILGTGNLL